MQEPTCSYGTLENTGLGKAGCGELPSNFPAGAKLLGSRDVNKGQKFGKMDSSKLGRSSTAQGRERNELERLRLPAPEARLRLLHVGGLGRKLCQPRRAGGLRGGENLSARIGLQGQARTMHALGGKGCVYLHTVSITIGSYFCLGLPDAMLVNVYNKQ